MTLSSVESARATPTPLNSSESPTLRIQIPGKTHLDRYEARKEAAAAREAADAKAAAAQEAKAGSEAASAAYDAAKVRLSYQFDPDCC